MNVLSIPECCPEGVLHFCPADTAGACVSDLGTSPYVLSYSSRTRDGSKTIFSFQLAYRNLVSACSAMAIDNVLLYVNSVYAVRSATANLGLLSAVIQPGSLGPLSYLNISMSSYASVEPNVLTIALDGDVSLSDLCVTPSGSSRVCNYVLVGTQYSAGSAPQACCPAGDIPSTLPSGRRLLALSDDAHAALAAGSSLCAKYNAFSSCFSLAPVEISETFDEGMTFSFKLTRASAEASCPTEFQVVVSSNAMASFKEGHGHIWAGGVPFGDHFSWILQDSGSSDEATVGSTYMASFTLKGRNLDRLSRVCSVRGRDLCVFRLVGESGCFEGVIATDFLFGSARNSD